MGFTERPVDFPVVAAPGKRKQLWRQRGGLGGSSSPHELQQRALSLQIRTLKGNRLARPLQPSNPQPSLMNAAIFWARDPRKIISGVSQGFLSPSRSEETLTLVSGEPRPSLSQEVTQSGM